MEDSWWTPEPKDLQVEGEEKEYFLELLMRESAPKKGATEEPTAVGNKAGQPVKKGATRKNKPASSRGNRNGSEKTSKGETGVSAGPERKEASARNEGGLRGASQALRCGWRHLTSLVTRGRSMGARKLAPSRKRDRKRK